MSAQKDEEENKVKAMSERMKAEHSAKKKNSINRTWYIMLDAHIYNVV